MLRVIQNKKGFTLIEVLVAATLLTIGMLGALEVLVLSMQQNLNNMARDESVRIAEQKMNELRTSSFGSLTGCASSTPCSALVTRKFKNSDRAFNIQWIFTTLSSTSVSVQVLVTWNIRGKDYSHSITSVISIGA
jgi:prepilin-type N-terminal cleavage/methylation domain-containing protein